MKEKYNGFLAKEYAIVLVCISICCSFIMLSNTIAYGQNLDLEALRNEAVKEGKIVWYESSPEDQIAKIQLVFNTRYPDIKLEHVRLRGADVGTRIIAESSADAPTADVVTTGLDILVDLNDRNLLAKQNWNDLGFGSDLISTPYALKSMVALYIIDYNSDIVSAKDAPATWNDLLDPKWKGKVGIWQKLSSIATLEPAWGKDKVLEFAKKFAAQNPVIYNSNYPLNNALAAGEISVAITNYHTVFPVLGKGAPVKMVFATPIPYEALCSSITTKAKNPKAAMLFMNWLHSTEGAKTYEHATHRGNPWIAGTETYEIIRGKELTAYSPEQNEEFKNMLKEIDNIILK